MSVMLSFLVVFFLIYSQHTFGYDVINRYRILQDRFKTEEMLRPLGHDFLIDLNLTLNKNITTVIKDAKDVSKTSGSDTEKLNAATAFLEKYNNTEQTARGKVNLGIPFFSFKLFGINFISDIRAGVDWGANLGIRTEELTLSTLIDLLPQDTPVEIVNAARNLTALPAPGTDLIAAIAATDPSNSILQDVAASLPSNTYLMPNNSTTPNVFIFTKLDVTAGPYISFIKNSFFGYFALYELYRRDLKARLTAESISKGQDLLGSAKNDNSSAFLTSDFRLGYTYSRYLIFISGEEMKWSTLKAPKEGSGGLNFEVNPLYRIHADATFGDHFKIAPFLGAHQRKGYEIQDGLYGGVDLGTHVLNERLGLQLRGMIDPEHYILSPRMRLLFLQVEYSLRVPRKTLVDDVVVSTLHSLNFRLFF